MKISQIVKEKRKHLGLTQENIAEYLAFQRPQLVNGRTERLIQILHFFPDWPDC